MESRKILTASLPIRDDISSRPRLRDALTKAASCYRGSITNRRYVIMAKAPATATGYCMKCKTQREIKNAKQITMKNGRPATEGTCTVCSTRMFKIGAST